MPFAGAAGAGWVVGDFSLLAIDLCLGGVGVAGGAALFTHFAGVAVTDWVCSDFAGDGLGEGAACCCVGRGSVVSRLG